MKIEGNNHEINLSVYQSKIKDWGRNNMRPFPWRHTEDAYRVLMAELMLIRTSAEQVKPVYEAFIEEYPTVEVLSQASRDEVRNILSPLGLVWRADCVYDTAIVLSEEYDGEIPDEEDELMKLNGVSQYVAGAVLCFAYGKPQPLIDTNTVRIVGRNFGMEVTNSSRRDERFRRIIRDMVDTDAPQLYNYSMLDLGAKLCTSRTPNCPECPIQPLCRYGRSRELTE